MSSATETRTRRWRRAKRTIRRRWVQACLVLLFWLVVLGVSARVLGPKAPKAGDTSKLNYMHCDNEACRFEIPYNKEMDGKRCLKCQGSSQGNANAKEGYLVGTEKSIKTGVQMSPWTRVYVALFVETVVMLALMTYLMYRTVPDPGTQYFVVACPYCNQRLRYRALSHGGQGACSRCKRILLGSPMKRTRCPKRTCSKRRRRRRRGRSGPGAPRPKLGSRRAGGNDVGPVDQTLVGAGVSPAGLCRSETPAPQFGPVVRRE